jgi:parallel beta-helix repeat protein
MALVLQDTFSSSGLTNWVAVNMEETGGVMKPTNYALDASAIFDTAHSGSSRPEIQINATTFTEFFLLICLVDSADLTSNHIRIKFSIGSSTPPAFINPDTITVSKFISTVETEKTPTNTSSISTGVVPTALSGNAISLRDKRLTTGDRLGWMAVNDGTNCQLFVFVNDRIRYHEEITGVTVSGKAGVFVTGNAAGDITFDNYYNQDITPRFVSQHASADDLNDGSDLTTNAWRTIPKAYAAQGTDEVVLVGAGTYTEKILGAALVDQYGTSLGNPRVPTAKNNSIGWAAMADQVVVTQAHPAFRANGETRFLYSYNIVYRNPIGASAVLPPVKLSNPGTDVQGPLNCTFQGGSIEDSYRNGFEAFSGQSFPDGQHEILDMKFVHNGYSASFYHQIYIGVRDCEIKWCDIDGDGGADNTTGYGIHIFSQGHTTQTNNTIPKYNWVHGHLNTNQGGIAMGSGDTVKAIGNHCYNNRDGIVAGFSGSNYQLINNVCFKNTLRGILVGTVSDPLIAGNTCPSNGTEGIGGNTFSTNALITNNLAWNNAGGDIVDPGASGWTEETNVEPLADPFKDSANDDYSIEAGSVAASGGTDLSGTIDAIDIVGFARGASWGVGAYEVVSTSIVRTEAVTLSETAALAIDAPINQVPGAQTFTTGVQTAFSSDLSVVCATNNLQTVRLKVNKGIVNVTAQGAVDVS